MKTFTINNKEVTDVYLNEIFNKWLDITEFKGDINSLSKLFIIDCIKVLKEMNDDNISKICSISKGDWCFLLKSHLQVKNIVFKYKYEMLFINSVKLIIFDHISELSPLFKNLLKLMESKL